MALYDWRQIRRHRPTLSAEFAAAVRHPVKRWPVTVAWAVLTLHLYGVLPRRLDPLHVVTTLLTPSN